MLIDAHDTATAIVGKNQGSAAPAPAYLRTAEAATYLGLGASTLERKRLDGSGPRYRVLGARAVRYAIADLDEWASACVVAANQAA